jgi:hypothetical protein
MKELNKYNALKIGEAAANRPSKDLLFAQTKKSSTGCGIKLGNHCQRKRVRNWMFNTEKISLPAKNAKKKFNRNLRPLDV